MSRTSEILARLLKNRALVRAPIWLYRARLGFVMGHRMLLLEHIGRKSGARRYAVLEVVERPAHDRYPRTWARIEPTLEAALQTPELDLPMVTLELAGR